MTRTYLLMYLSFLFLTVTCGVGAAWALDEMASITGIRGGVNKGTARLVLERSLSTPYRVNLEGDQTRLVITLDRTQTISAATPQNLPAGMGIFRIEQTRQEGAGVTLSFVLQKPAQILSSFSLPKTADKPGRIVVDYRFSSPSSPKKESAKPYAPKPQNQNIAPQQILGTLTYPSQTKSPAPSAEQPPFLKNLDLPAPAPTHPRLPVKPIPSLKQDQQMPPSSAVPRPLSDQTSPRLRVIVIDAGHGGKDPGAIGVGGAYEKNITLAAARELKKQLEETGRFKIVMTRNNDTFILLPHRVKIAREAKADLFISLHADTALEAKYTDGLSIYTLSDTASDAQTEKLAAQENKVDLLAGLDLSHEQEDVANILIDLAMRENMNQSRFFAGKVVTAMSKGGTNLLEKPHRYAGFAVLKAPDIPSVLVEMGFLSNKAEAKKLQDGAHRRRLMENLTTGIIQYFDYIDKASSM